ncbi:MAG: hypothetical protein AAGF59_06465, partial [Pseudomonadota bacterium]
MKKLIVIVLSSLFLAIPAFADDDDDAGFGQAGVLSSKNRGDIPELLLSAGEPLLESGKIELKSGTYYELEITADGSQELQVAGSGFFRAIWIDEIVINDLEV